MKAPQSLIKLLFLVNLFLTSTNCKIDLGNVAFEKIFTILREDRPMLQTLLLTDPVEVGGTKIDKILERVIQAGSWNSKALNGVGGS